MYEAPVKAFSLVFYYAVSLFVLLQVEYDIVARRQNTTSQINIKLV